MVCTYACARVLVCVCVCVCVCARARAVVLAFCECTEALAPACEHVSVSKETVPSNVSRTRFLTAQRGASELPKNQVQSRVKAACREAGTSQDVQLVAVSKFKSAEEILAAYSAGQRVFGENYVQVTFAWINTRAPHALMGPWSRLFAGECGRRSWERRLHFLMISAGTLLACCRVTRPKCWWEVRKIETERVALCLDPLGGFVRAFYV
jgi:hypothetical protein